MIKDLIKVANKLDSLGLQKEADYLDSVIRKLATDYLEKHPLDWTDEDYEDFERDEETFEIRPATNWNKVPYPQSAEELNQKGLTQESLGDWSKEDQDIREMESEEEFESYNPKLHKEPSYEMDEEAILEGIRMRRELEKNNPSVRYWRRNNP